MRWLIPPKKASQDISPWNEITMCGLSLEVQQRPLRKTQVLKRVRKDKEHKTQRSNRPRSWLGMHIGRVTLHKLSSVSRLRSMKSSPFVRRPFWSKFPPKNVFHQMVDVSLFALNVWCILNIWSSSTFYLEQNKRGKECWKLPRTTKHECLNWMNHLLWVLDLNGWFWENTRKPSPRSGAMAGGPHQWHWPASGPLCGALLSWQPVSIMIMAWGSFNWNDQILALDYQLDQTRLAGGWETLPVGFRTGHVVLRCWWGLKNVNTIMIHYIHNIWKFQCQTILALQTLWSRPKFVTPWPHASKLLSGRSTRLRDHRGPPTDFGKVSKKILRACGPALFGIKLLKIWFVTHMSSSIISYMWDMILEPCTKSKYFPLNNSDPHPTSFDVAAQGRRNLLSHEWWMPRPGGTQAQQAILRISVWNIISRIRQAVSDCHIRRSDEFASQKSEKLYVWIGEKVLFNLNLHITIRISHRKKAAQDNFQFFRLWFALAMKTTLQAMVSSILDLEAS